MTNERCYRKLGAETRDHVNVVRQHGDFMHVDGRLLGRRSNDVNNIRSISLSNATRSESGVPRDMSKNAIGSVCHRLIEKQSTLC